MHEISLLVWLKVRHIRSACAYWGYMFGADIESKADLIDKLYYLYLLVLLGAWTASAWMFAVSSVEEAYVFSGAILLDITGALLVFALLAVLVRSTVSALWRSPLRLISPDLWLLVPYVRSVGLVALIDAMPRTLAFSFATSLGVWLLCSGCAAAGMQLHALALSSTVACAVAAALLIARAAGYARLAFAKRGPRRAAWSIGALAFEILLCAGATFAVSGAGWRAPLDAFSAANGVHAAAPGVAVGVFALAVACSAAALVCGANRADLACAIEEGAADAALFGVRRLAFQAPDQYRELRRRYRIAHRRLRPTFRLASGPAAAITRAALSHARQFESLLGIAAMGVLIVPLSAWTLAHASSPVVIVAWAYGMFMALASLSFLRELSLAFREDVRVTLVRDQIPLSNLVLAVLDALPALGILEACSFITMLLVNACAPGSFTMVEVAISVLLGTGFSLVAALDGVEVTFIRVGVTSVVGLVLLLAAAGLLALWAPIAVIYGLVVVDLAFIALLENGK